MYEFTLLNPSTLFAYHSFLPEKIRLSVSTISPDYKLIAYGVTLNTLPVGVCVALLNLPIHFLEFLHIQVISEHRNHRIGRTLIAKIQEEAVKSGARIFSLIYRYPHTL